MKQPCFKLYASVKNKIIALSSFVFLHHDVQIDNFTLAILLMYITRTTSKDFNSHTSYLDRRIYLCMSFSNIISIVLCKFRKLQGQELRFHDHNE
jgi:hypothetical protein